MSKEWTLPCGQCGTTMEPVGPGKAKCESCGVLLTYEVSDANPGGISDARLDMLCRMFLTGEQSWWEKHHPRNPRVVMKFEEMPADDQDAIRAGARALLQTLWNDMALAHKNGAVVNSEQLRAILHLLRFSNEVVLSSVTLKTVSHAEVDQARGIIHRLMLDCLPGLVI